ncbi:hypothetical protein PYCCODRAFT_1432074 [Trametes coccinea BRFM310]|uniref:Uncharacterized protein n=1 Tax=Trametes coccinea (strain BRFM310) TaxID=1353009 RepID=A0A1Y2IWN0_TRAC3|nr:hypothetical protein PYCCODRAFT_1432074 [Trametes coccinea BRFM310]
MTVSLYPVTFHSLCSYGTFRYRVSSCARFQHHRAGERFARTRRVRMPAAATQHDLLLWPARSSNLDATLISAHRDSVGSARHSRRLRDRNPKTHRAYFVVQQRSFTALHLFSQTMLHLLPGAPSFIDSLRPRHCYAQRRASFICVAATPGV